MLGRSTLSPAQPTLSGGCHEPPAGLNAACSKQDIDVAFAGERGRQQYIHLIDACDGGSKNDAEVIAAADEHGLAMVLTGMRHFRH